MRLLALVALGAGAARAEPRVHTVFCAECTNNFDYKSIGAFYSHNVSGMPGGITRLLACDSEQLRTYKGLHIGPTFVHKNHARISHVRELGPGETVQPFGAMKRDSSPSYNKPGSIMHWVQESQEAKLVDYVLYIDADMLLRLPMDPIALGVRKGVVVSEHVGYLDVGIRNGLAFAFLPEDQAHYAGDDLDNHKPSDDGYKHASAGWYHFFHIDDIRQIAHRWLYYCEQMRLNPQKYWKMIDPKTGKPGGTDHDIVTGDAYVGHGSPPWISEMYGYVFAASEAKLKHILTHGVVVYPDEIGSGSPQEPKIIHYGLHCTVGKFHFTKYTFGNFNAVGCTGKTFGEPPVPKHLERLCAETVLTLNDAMCDFYEKPHEEGGCALQHEANRCPKWKPAERGQCADSHTNCANWAKDGECKNNPGFMEGSCPKSCGLCDRAVSADVPVWRRGLAIAAGEDPGPLRQREGPRQEVQHSLESRADQHSLAAAQQHYDPKSHPTDPHHPADVDVTHPHREAHPEAKGAHPEAKGALPEAKGELPEAKKAHAAASSRATAGEARSEPPAGTDETEGIEHHAGDVHHDEEAAEAPPPAAVETAGMLRGGGAAPGGDEGGGKKRKKKAKKKKRKGRDDSAGDDDGGSDGGKDSLQREIAEHLQQHPQREVVALAEEPSSVAWRLGFVWLAMIGLVVALVARRFCRRGSRKRSIPL